MDVSGAVAPCVYLNKDIESNRGGGCMGLGGRLRRAGTEVYREVLRDRLGEGTDVSGAVAPCVYLNKDNIESIGNF